MNRVPRGLLDPIFTENSPKSFTKSLVAQANGETLELRYNRSRWQAVDYDRRGVKQRRTSGVIWAEGTLAGSFSVVETRIPTLMDRDDFFDEMDSHSSETAHLAEVILHHWEDPTVIGDYGDIVELRRAWMVPTQSKNGRLGVAINALVDREFGGRSLLILKAFPLEYESNVTDDNTYAFNRRRSAMLRHYVRLFGVAPLPGSSGEDGWMYAIPERLRDRVPEPMPEID